MTIFSLTSKRTFKKVLLTAKAPRSNWHVGNRGPGTRLSEESEDPIESWEEGSIRVSDDSYPLCETPVEDWIMGIDIESTDKCLSQKTGRPGIARGRFNRSQKGLGTTPSHDHGRRAWDREVNAG